MLLLLQRSVDVSQPVSSPAVSSSWGGSQEEGDVLIELRNVAKAFGNKTILKKASFKIRRGEAIGVIGAATSQP